MITSILNAWANCNSPVSPKRAENVFILLLFMLLLLLLLLLLVVGKITQTGSNSNNRVV